MTVTTTGTDATTETDSTTEAEETTTDDAPKGNNREARYRVERNQAREALTAAEARITAFQTREVERLASELAQPSDLFGIGGVSLADLVGEDGEVDPELVEDAVAALIEARPGLARNPLVRATDPSQGRINGGSNPPLNWNDLLKR